MKTQIITIIIIILGAEISSAVIAFGNWNSDYYSVDLTTGKVTSIASSPAYYHMDFDSSGRLYAASRDTDAIYEIVDPFSGDVELIAPLPDIFVGGGFAINPINDQMIMALFLQKKAEQQ